MVAKATNPVSYTTPQRRQQPPRKARSNNNNKYDTAAKATNTKKTVRRSSRRGRRGAAAAAGAAAPAAAAAVANVADPCPSSSSALFATTMVPSPPPVSNVHVRNEEGDNVGNEIMLSPRTLHNEYSYQEGEAVRKHQSNCLPKEIGDFPVSLQREFWDEVKRHIVAHQQRLHEQEQEQNARQAALDERQRLEDERGEMLDRKEAMLHEWEETLRCQQQLRNQTNVRAANHVQVYACRETVVVRRVVEHGSSGVPNHAREPST